MRHIKKLSTVVAFIVACSIILSSCGLSGRDGKNKEEENIDTAVSDFLDSVTDGSFADDNYDSDLISDKSFEKLEFKDEDAEDLMILAFEEIEFEIDKIEVADEDATCDVTLTAIDLDEILDDLGDVYSFYDIEDAIDAKKAPTQEYEVTFELEYDDEEWIISDLSDLVEVICAPYTDLMTVYTGETVITEPSEITTPEATVKTFDMFIAMPGTELSEGNAVQDKIAEITGAKIKETWLTGQTAEEAIGVMIASGEYPDFIDSNDGYPLMLDAGALIPIDEYWDKYPNIKNYLSEEEWNMCRKEDGHIYAIPQFGIVNEKDTSPAYNDEAWWIQTRVLKWAGYPEVNTLDEYFTLLEDYAAANPTHLDGTTVIPFTILTEDWRYYCLESPPILLAGFTSDVSVMVDPVTRMVIDYNVTDIAKQYFQKLNEEYEKGIVDAESFTQTYGEYIAKISTGRVLGFVDNYWDWGYTAEDAIKSAELEGCTYVPLGIVSEEGIVERYHNESALDVSGGLSITTGCEDIDGAMKFIDDLLSQEVMTLRFWGIEGINYKVGDDGIFYRTEEMRANSYDANYKADNLCLYNYFPQYEGMNLDGINAWRPDDQPTEFFEGLSPEVQECLEAYGAKTYTEMLNPSQPNQPWYPMWTYTNDLTTETPAGMAFYNMSEVKHEYLPGVVMANDFEAAWEEYLAVYYERAEVQVFLDAMQAEVDRRIAVAEGN